MPIPKDPQDIRWAGSDTQGGRPGPEPSPSGVCVWSWMVWASDGLGVVEWLEKIKLASVSDLDRVRHLSEVH